MHIDNKIDKLKRQNLLFSSKYLWIITFSITSLNFLITYNFKNLSIDYIYFYLVDLLSTYIILKFYALGIHYLNKKVPLEQDFIKRVTYQLTLHTLSVIIFYILVNELLDYIFFNGERLSLSFNFYTQDTFVALVFIYFLHAIYFALFLLFNKDNVESLNLKLDAKIKVVHGSKFKILSLYNIIYVYSEFGITYVVDNDFEKYTSSLTLKKFESMLDESFFRANRKIIISRKIIDSYNSSTNGKVEIIIKENTNLEFSEPIIISRDKASSFRSWLDKQYFK